MENTGLPMESAIQMMSPEYYNFIRATKTPLLSSQLTKDGVQIRSYTPQWKRPLDTRYLKNFEKGPNWISPSSRDGDLSIVSKEINSNISRFSARDLDDLVNNVQYIGNRFPYADRIYPGYTQGYIKGEGSTNSGAVYGSFRPGHAVGYTYSSNGVIPSGKVHYVTVGGKPLFSNNFSNVTDLKNHLGMNNTHEYSASGFGKKSFSYLHNAGYDWFGDLGRENQFAVDNPYYVKNLIGNNGDFNTKDINWFHKKGGKLIKRK